MLPWVIRLLLLLSIFVFSFTLCFLVHSRTVEERCTGSTSQSTTDNACRNPNVK